MARLVIAAAALLMLVGLTAAQNSTEPAPAPAPDMYLRELDQGFINCTGPVNISCGMHAMHFMGITMTDSDSDSDSDSGVTVTNTDMVFTTAHTIKMFCATSRSCMDAVVGVAPCKQNVATTLAAAYNQTILTAEFSQDEIDQGMQAFDGMCGCVSGDELDTACVQRATAGAGRAGPRISSEVFDSSGGSFGDAMREFAEMIAVMLACAEPVNRTCGVDVMSIVVTTDDTDTTTSTDASTTTDTDMFENVEFMQALCTNDGCMEAFTGYMVCTQNLSGSFAQSPGQNSSGGQSDFDNDMQASLSTMQSMCTCLSDGVLDVVCAVQLSATLPEFGTGLLASPPPPPPVFAASSSPSAGARPVLSTALTAAAVGLVALMQSSI